MSSSAYSLTAIMPAPSFKVTEGTPVKGGLQGPDADHYFCPDCKTWMFTRIPGYDEIVNVRSVLLDDLHWTEPFMETMTSSKLPWAETPARHRYEGFPPPEGFMKLMGEFAPTSWQPDSRSARSDFLGNVDPVASGSAKTKALRP